MRSRLTLFALPLLLALAVAGDPPAEGDEAVLAAIDKGREAFKAGRDQEAIENLQKAIGLIQAKAMKGLAAFLPSRDEAQWEMGEIDSQSGNWGSGETAFTWSQVQRRYTRRGVDDGPEVTVMISNSPQLIEAQRGMVQMLKDPAMRAMMAQAQGGQKIDFVEEGGWLGMITTENDRCNAMVFHAKVMVQVQVNRGDDKLAKEFWAAIDRDGLGGVSK